MNSLNKGYYEMIIAGGAIMNSCVAHFVKQGAAPTDPDPIVQFDSTVRTSASERRLFYCFESLYAPGTSAYFIKESKRDNAFNGGPVSVAEKIAKAHAVLDSEGSQPSIHVFSPGYVMDLVGGA